jgi:hypothetical protein
MDIGYPVSQNYEKNLAIAFLFYRMNLIDLPQVQLKQPTELPNFGSTINKKALVGAVKHPSIEKANR